MATADILKKLKNLLISLLVITWVSLVMDGIALSGQRMAVTSDVANIRSGPNTDTSQLWQVERYYPLNILEKKGEWYRFQDFEGDQGWIHASLVGKIPTVIVKVNQSNIRTGPGTNYDIAFTVDKGIPFKVLQTKGQWIEVQHADGDKGWIFKGLVW